MVLSNMYLPIPSQLVLPLSGFLVGQGRFSFPLVILASTAGSVIGTLVLYAAGRWLDEKPLRRFFKRYGRFVFLAEPKVGLFYTLKTVRRSKLESIMSYKDLLEERVECHPPVFPGRICLWVKGPQ